MTKTYTNYVTFMYIIIVLGILTAPPKHLKTILAEGVAIFSLALLIMLSHTSLLFQPDWSNQTDQTVATVYAPGRGNNIPPPGNVMSIATYLPQPQWPLQRKYFFGTC